MLGIETMVVRVGRPMPMQQAAIALPPSLGRYAVSPPQLGLSAHSKAFPKTTCCRTRTAAAALQ